MYNITLKKNRTYFKNIFIKIINIKKLIPSQEQQLKKISNIVNTTMTEIFTITNTYKEMDYYLFGGAIRDTLNNKYELINNLDIYIIDQYHEKNNFINFLKNKFENVEIICEQQHINIYENQYMNTYKQHVNKYHKQYDNVIKIKDKKLLYNINLVFGHLSINGYLETKIDFNLCKIALNTKEKNIKKGIIITDEYLNDFNNKTITLKHHVLSNIGHIYSIKNKLSKILKKYPDFQFCHDKTLSFLSIPSTLLFELIAETLFESKISLEHKNLDITINNNLQQSKTNKSKKI